MPGAATVEEYRATVCRVKEQLTGRYDRVFI